MITGYTRPLYLLPFDHRASYISGLFGWKEPLNVEQMVTVANSKHIIYAGFQRAIADQWRWPGGMDGTPWVSLRWDAARSKTGSCIG